MEVLKAEIDELKAKLKKVEEGSEVAGKRWEEERNEILVSSQEVVTEAERRMEERVKEVEKRFKEEVEEVKQNAAEETEDKKQTLVNIKMLTPSVYKEGRS